MKPFFLDSKAGKVFCLYHPPHGESLPKGNILFIPPFAEELNRSRHMINRQARRFAQAGYAVLILDLYGTGDSEGSFGDASIDIWQADILAAQEWFSAQQKAPLILWAMRSGALLAVHALQHNPGVSNRLLLWSPVSNGKTFISQYLRIKLAAGMNGKASGGSKNMKDLWADLDQGQSLEIAGYEISPKLVFGFSDLSLMDMILPEGTVVNWLETTIADPAKLSPAATKIIKDWQVKNIKISARAIKDISFWTLQEPEWADNYLDQTMQFLNTA